MADVDSSFHDDMMRRFSWYRELVKRHGTEIVERGGRKVLVLAAPSQQCDICGATAWREEPLVHDVQAHALAQQRARRHDQAMDLERPERAVEIEEGL